MKRGAFSLVEIMAVLAIVAIVSSLTFGAYKGISSGNKRTTCQSNLGQIYGAMRQYSRDYDGRFPYFNPGVASESTAAPLSIPNGRGIGLWALYTYADATGNALSQEANKPRSTYLRTTKFFHCPSDDYKRVNGVIAPLGVSTSAPNDAAGQINSEYLSYQILDDEPSAMPATERWTFSTFRRRNPASPGVAAKRQLQQFQAQGTGDTLVNRRSAPDTTVVLWCRFHRSLKVDGSSNGANAGNDNVLFLDGSVQSIAMQQSVGAGTCQSWERRPRNEESTAANCS